LEVMALAADAGLRPPSAHQLEGRPYPSEDMAHFVSALVGL